MQRSNSQVSEVVTAVGNCRFCENSIGKLTYISEEVVADVRNCRFGKISSALLTDAVTPQIATTSNVYVV